MGLFDDLEKSAAGVMGEGPQHAAMTSAVLGLIGSQGSGGLQTFWVGTGPNQAVTADQIQAALGSDTVQPSGKNAAS